ncbi:MAG: FkbM family methyltransferase [Patescibacteria group bacterium]|jgi:FkbM family methyltransferase
MIGRELLSLIQLRLRPVRYYGDPRTANDRWVASTLKGRRNGYFVEAGASNGIGASNTYTLERYFGWSGICVEPNDYFFEQLRANRSCICENVCLSDSSNPTLFMELSGAADPSLPYYSGTKACLDKKKISHWRSGKEVLKPAVTLQELLDNQHAPRVIDYLCLDPEGSEYVILKNFDYERYVFRLISIEGGSCGEILSSAGYIEVSNKYNRVANWEHYYVHSDYASL